MNDIRPIRFIRLIRPIRPIRPICPIRPIRPIGLLSAAALILAAAALAAPSSARASVFQKIPNNLGLVGYWSFNEGTSTIAGDFSGKGNNGTLTSMAFPATATSGWTTAGKRGGALTFDGTNDVVSAGNAYNGVKTVAFWMKANNTTQKILDLNGTATVEVISGTITANSFTSPTIYVDGAVNSAVNTAWRHVVITTGTGINASALDIGRISTGYFNGIIDEVRIYNRALSAAEIATLYQSGAAKLTAPNNLGLVGYWSFNEGTSTIAGDFSGKGNNGTLTNMAFPATAASGWTTAGKRGGALTFDGTNDYVAIPTSTLSGAFTVSFWWNNVANSDTRIALSNGVASGNKIGTVSSKFFIRVISGGGNPTDNTIALPSQDAWHFFVITRNASDKIDLYIDGGAPNRLFTDTAQTGNFLLTEIGTASIDAQYFKGLIDEIRIYNRALNAAEIASLYNSGLAKINSSQNTRLTNGLVSMWSFNGADISGTTAYDRSGQGNNGTLANSPTKVIGKVGQALGFLISNGTTAYVSAGMSGFNFSAGTLSFWYKPNYSTNQTTTYHRIITVGPYSYTAGGIRIFNNQQFQAIRISHGSAGSDIISGTHLAAGNWYHFVYTWDSTAGFRRYYLNSALNSSQSATWTPNTSPSAIIIGQSLDVGAIADGLLDEVRVYNRALSAAEILQLYNMGK